MTLMARCCRYRSVRLADPTQTLAADRPARFLRIEKAVSQPDEDLRDIDNTAFGVTTQFGMKEIVGYRNGRARWLGHGEGARQCCAHDQRT